MLDDIKILQVFWDQPEMWRILEDCSRGFPNFLPPLAKSPILQVASEHAPARLLVDLGHLSWAADTSAARGTLWGALDGWWMTLILISALVETTNL